MGWGVEVGTGEEKIPSALEGDLLRIPLAVDTLPLVEIEIAVARRIFLHLNVIVSALIFVENASTADRGAQRAIEHQQGDYRDDDRHPCEAKGGAAFLTPEADEADEIENAGKEQEGAERTEFRDGVEDRQ